MKYIFFSLLSLALCFNEAHAQFSRLHVKTPSTTTVGITTGSTGTKVLGFNHTGSAGVISTTTLDGSVDATPLLFSTAGQTRLTIFGNGYVGIGVTGTPTAELTVGGKIHAREVKVNVTAGTGPDYVFLSTYRLRPLSELSLYIQQHHHLPEVPAAAEMEQEGLNLSEMNLLLLKKVEELTLYLLAEHEKTAALEKELAALRAELEALKTTIKK